MTSIVVSVVDSKTVHELVASVVALFGEDAGRHDPTVDTTWPISEGAAYYTSILDDPECLLLVATAGGRPAGHLVGKLRDPTTLQPIRFAVLESMRVAEDVRREGVGTRLIEHFFEWARDRGAYQVSVTAYANNDAARRFYAGNGFVPQSVTLRRTLPAVAP